MCTFVARSAGQSVISKTIGALPVTALAYLGAGLPCHEPRARSPQRAAPLVPTPRPAHVRSPNSQGQSIAVPENERQPLLAPQPTDHTAVLPRENRQGVTTRHLGTSSHVSSMPAARAGALMHRRSHAGDGKIRSFAHTTSDGPKVLASIRPPSPPLRRASAVPKPASSA